MSVRKLAKAIAKATGLPLACKACGRKFSGRRGCEWCKRETRS